MANRKRADLVQKKVITEDKNLILSWSKRQGDFILDSSDIFLDGTKLIAAQCTIIENQEGTHDERRGAVSCHRVLL
jgi:hypothetical protein